MVENDEITLYFLTLLTLPNNKTKKSRKKPILHICLTVAQWLGYFVSYMHRKEWVDLKRKHWSERGEGCGEEGRGGGALRLIWTLISLRRLF